MDEKKYTLTFYVDNQKEEHPELRFESQIMAVREEELTKPPVLPIGRNRKEKLRKRLVSNRYKPTYGARKRFKLESDRFNIERRLGSKLVMVACSAVAVGIIMGLMVLSFFAQEPGQEQAAIPTERSLGDPADEKTLLIPAGYVEKDHLYLPSRTYYVLQAGAFSDQHAAQKMNEEIKEEGFPAAIFPTSEAYRVYLALGSNQDEGAGLSQLLEGENFDVYVRTHETQQIELNIGKVEEKLDLLPTFLAISDQLLNQLLKLSTAVLVQEEAIAEEDLKNVEEMHRKLLLEVQQVLNQASTPMAEHVEQLMRILTVGVSAVEAYTKQPHTSYAWQIQQAGLNYLFQYERLLDWMTKEI